MFLTNDIAGLMFLGIFIFLIREIQFLLNDFQNKKRNLK